MILIHFRKCNSRRKSNFGVHTNDEVNKSDGQRRVLININHRLNEVDVFSAPQLSRVAKAHPFGGIRFLYDNIVQSLGKFSTSKGAGCFLAHSMGLSKPFRSVPLLMCFYNIPQLGGSWSLFNTIRNWMSDHWFPSAHSEDGCFIQPRSFEVYLLNKTSKAVNSRFKVNYFLNSSTRSNASCSHSSYSWVILDWTSHGVVIGYELFRILYTHRESILKKWTVKR
jgi:hypothetical protein